jgi:hypothetical protein
MKSVLPRSAHIGFVAKVNAFYDAAMEAGAVDNGKPGAGPVRRFRCPKTEPIRRATNLRVLP